ncbi:glycosyltransferase family 2 protein [Vulgatibacter incomptus]|uniref:Glycosyl transferase, group 2 family protein n=1 Tax=Vulgatibacter incomptus TaxID=1391653 RepID=A0A0K1PAE5_9BACT|nr:glycosyltransferase family 2 protein [Vulgatibacter incomptus]AKU90508.1 Glycosyl transferase, group 2 family protein [Vulgatibacter incomptus]
MAAWVFWLSALGLLHTYLLYPLILVALDAWAGILDDLRYLGGGRDRRKRPEPLSLPTVSLVVAAWNEAKVIGAKLQNSLELDYPEEKLEIVIGSDGSDDGTDAIVAACPDPRVRLDGSDRRTGKIGVLKRVVPQARGEILVFSDANTILDSAAIRKLVRHFDDPSVGCVCGRLRLFNPRSETYEESAYWRYESFLKLREGRRGAVMGANGGIYALRRSLFPDMPADTVVEDFVVACRTLLRGYDVIYDPEALAWEETAEDYAQERARRVRIAAGNFQALGLVGGLLHPREGFAAFAFFSHKLLRWLAPLFLVGLFVSSLLSSGRPFYSLALGAQLLFYWLALIGFVARLHGPIGRLGSFARYFVEMNVGMAQGFFRWASRSQKVTWQRTARV